MTHDRLRDALDTIHADETLKAQTRAYLAQKTRRRSSAVRVRRLAALACCLLLVCAGLGGYQAYFTPTSAISIDINPSLELEVNRFDRVISVTGYQEDGLALAEALDLKHLNYQDALEEVLACEPVASCLASDETLLITVAGNGGAQQERLLQGVKACTAGTQNARCAAADAETLAAAREAGLSLGKYTALLQLQALDPDITAGDIEGLTMREIREWMETLSPGSWTGGPGHGAGSGNGSGTGGSQGHGAGNGSHRGGN